jgi:hypothetical protein
MTHSNNDLRYRVVLVSESNSPPETSSPVAGGEISPSSLPPAPLAYQAIPIEETFTRPIVDAVPVARPVPAPDSAEPIYQVLPVVETAPEDRRLYAMPALIRRRRSRRVPWTLEKNGMESLAYLFREGRLVAWLIGGLALATAIGSALFIFLTSPEPESAVFVLPWAGFPLYGLCFICGFWNGVLKSATAGEAGKVFWPGLKVRLILEGCGRCLWCLLAGPVVPLAAAYYFWLNSGDLTTLDWCILAELVFVAASYWLFSFLAVAEKDSIWYATPANVLRVIRVLGWHSLLTVILMFVWAVVHGLWALGALSEMHRFIGSGWFSLWWCSVFAVYEMTCLLRALGVRFYRCRLGAPAGATPALWTPRLPAAPV